MGRAIRRVEFWFSNDVCLIAQWRAGCLLAIVVVMINGEMDIFDIDPIFLCRDVAAGDGPVEL